MVLLYKAASYVLWYVGLALYWPGMKLQEWALLVKGRWHPETERQMAVARALLRRYERELKEIV